MPIDQAFNALINELNIAILPQSVQFMIYISPVVLAAILFAIFWPLWIDYIRADNFLKLKRVLLEIRLPKDTFKSPLAMELFLTAFHNTADGNYYEQYWAGGIRPWFSLELVSVEGNVKMFIWVPEKSRAFIESSLYAQFPGIEIIPREDYTKTVHHDPSKFAVWAGEFKLTKPDAYPIKTYVDYGLDKDPKEEFKVDPMVPLLEYLGSVGPNQQVWIQIVIRAHKDNKIKPGHFFKKTDAWKDETNKIINEIMLRDMKTKIAGKPDKEGKLSPIMLTKGEQEVVTALERSLSKQAFDTGIRALYIAQKEFFNPTNIGAIIGSFKQFSSETLNGFKPGSDWLPKIEYFWQDYKDIRKNRMNKMALAAYKRRSFFYAPYKAGHFVLNTEELATIFHFPGRVAGTPTIERVPSKKAQAPVNLPI